MTAIDFLKERDSGDGTRAVTGPLHMPNVEA